MSRQTPIGKGLSVFSGQVASGVTAIGVRNGGECAPVAENSGETAMNVAHRGRPFKPGKSGNPGGRPRIVGELRELARAHAPKAIEELARLALKAKSETARVAAIRELLDRGYGKSTQFLAAENQAVPSDMTREELREELLGDFERFFPEFKMVPVKRPTLIAAAGDRAGNS